MTRLIDMKRSGRLSPDLYKKMRAAGHQDNTNVSEEELRKTLGVYDISRGE